MRKEKRGEERELTMHLIKFMILPMLVVCIPYNGNFLYGVNFRIFHMSVLHAKMKTKKV